MVMILTDHYDRVILEWSLPILDSIAQAFNDRLLALFHNIAREGQRAAVWRHN